jgi:hypothetical protein
MTYIKMTTEKDPSDFGEWSLLSPLPGLLASYQVDRFSHEDEETANRLDREMMLVIGTCFAIMAAMTFAV